MAILRVSSLDNERVRRVLALQRSTRRRMRDGLMVVEGTRLVESLAAAGGPVDTLFFTEGYVCRDPGNETLVAELVPCNDFEPRGTLPESVMAQRCPTWSRLQGILVVVPLPRIPVRRGPQFVLIPDGVRDPGNLGTLLRAAWASGATQVLIPPGVADYTSPRCSAPAWERIPPRHPGDPVEHHLEHHRIHASLDSESAAGEALLGRRLAWRRPRLSSTARASGASDAARSAGGYVHIPMPGDAESLNAAMAATILAFGRAATARRQAQLCSSSLCHRRISPPPSSLWLLSFRRAAPSRPPASAPL